MAKIYFYKLIVDDGGAPCVTPSLLSLAICKPMIRATAEVGNLIIGFAANSLWSDNRIIYVARVTDRLENGDYFKLPKYKRRGDCIYEWRRGGFVERPGATFHGSPGDLAHDLGGPPSHRRATSLLSREFCYFGDLGSNAYKAEFPIVEKAVMALGRGHRVNHSPKLLAELEQMAGWVCSLTGPCIKGSPSSGPLRGRCHRGGGSCMVSGEKRC